MGPAAPPRHGRRRRARSTPGDCGSVATRVCRDVSVPLPGRRVSQLRALQEGAPHAELSCALLVLVGTRCPCGLSLRGGTWAARLGLVLPMPLPLGQRWELGGCGFPQQSRALRLPPGFNPSCLVLQLLRGLPFHAGCTAACQRFIRICSEAPSLRFSGLSAAVPRPRLCHWSRRRSLPLVEKRGLAGPGGSLGAWCEVSQESAEVLRAGPWAEHGQEADVPGGPCGGVKPCPGGGQWGPFLSLFPTPWSCPARAA